MFICRTADHVIHAAEQVLASRNLFEEPNGEVLVQSCLDGTEYAVDTVSADGQRYVCGVWEYPEADHRRRAADIPTVTYCEILTRTRCQM